PEPAVAAPSIDRAPIERSLASGKFEVGVFREALRESSEALRQRFLRNDPIEDLVRERAAVVDLVIVAAWRHYAGALGEQADLVAVGGYGRGELHPHSDIDLLVLLERAGGSAADEAVSRFLTFLWDI